MAKNALTVLRVDGNFRIASVKGFRKPIRVQQEIAPGQWYTLGEYLRANMACAESRLAYHARQNA